MVIYGAIEIQNMNMQTLNLSQKVRQQLAAAMGYVAQHWILALYALMALLPVVLVLRTLVKSGGVALSKALTESNHHAFMLAGDMDVQPGLEVWTYAHNCLLITCASLVGIFVLGALAAWVLNEKKQINRRMLGNRLHRFFFAIACMVPIRLAAVYGVQTLMEMNWLGTASASCIVYVAQGLPLAIMIFAEFMSQVPGELKDAARCDGVSELRIFIHVVLPLIRPALLTVGVFTMVPIWNDLWSPLILVQSDKASLMTLGLQQLASGQMSEADWLTVLASLSLAVIPAITLYSLFSRQLIAGGAPLEAAR